ncbi:NDP-hexose 2,3-dehydratase family protein [Amycolatopsis sp. cmx-4-83]|uniref:NDP-hexose 2,3-dehydratase family protein n=1 Tax=Amycolatopsis sp. cmx-4-83 TaxID=2790940 RepID=UPI00397954C7
MTLSSYAELRRADAATAERIARSAAATEGVLSTTEVDAWLAERREADALSLQRIPFSALRSWHVDEATGDLRHDSGRFFQVHGLAVEFPGSAVPRWTQPIINQPEIGILGILVQEFDGVLHFLMQAKNEPGNSSGIQLSPTVQATRSNYTRVHQGRAVPYVDYFREPGEHRVLADVLQSEQGSWFYRKRNRNIVVQLAAGHEAEPHAAFRWLTLGQIHRLLAADDVVNMDTRTVLSCLPFATDEPGTSSLHPPGEVLSWITDARSRTEITARPVPLSGIPGWVRDDAEIRHETGAFFRVVAVDARSKHREVGGWTQPMIEPAGLGVVAFLLTRFDGVPHVLVHARVEPGYLDLVELAPTVQCRPENYQVLSSAARPAFLDEVLGAPPERILFESLLSEEGGRFLDSLNRYLIVEVPPAAIPAPGPDHRWLTVPQLVGLLRHSHYLNVQARSLVSCLHSLGDLG